MLTTVDSRNTAALHFNDIQELDGEIRAIASSMDSNFDFSFYGKMFKDIISLFKGEYPGYKPCNTPYHDLSHTLAVLLASMRMLHGRNIESRFATAREIEICMASALFHDTGYIQTEDDEKGTGARHTLTHISRSASLMKKYFLENDRPQEDSDDCESIILCTNARTRIKDIEFSGNEMRTLGQILGTADIVSQMADEIYLEKLPLLYLELQEGHIKDFNSEYDLFRKTIGFHQAMKKRMDGELGDMIRYIRSHFKAWLGEDKDFYTCSIKNNMAYLNCILDKKGEEYCSMLRRKNERTIFGL